MRRAKKRGYARDWQEKRRECAYELGQQGWQQKDIAEAVGVSNGAVSKWLARAPAKGAEALKSQPAPGGQSKLNAEQMGRLPEILGRGAEAYGFRGARWTRARIRQVIEEVFGVSDHVDHMSCLMGKIGWTQQKPREVATQQNLAAVEVWKTNWPAVEKKPSKRGKR